MSVYRVHIQRAVGNDPVHPAKRSESESAKPCSDLAGCDVHAASQWPSATDA